MERAGGSEGEVEQGRVKAVERARSTYMYTGTSIKRTDTGYFLMRSWIPVTFIPY